MIKVILFMCISVWAEDKLIYGEDNRKEPDFFNSAYFREISRSVAALISEKDMVKTQAGYTISPNIKSLKETYKFCEGERFSDQPSLAICTGFLVSPTIMVTAGHCYSQEEFSCQNKVWVFDFKVNQTNLFKTENVYRCKKVLERKLDRTSGIDYTVVELDRGVLDRKSLKLSKVEPLERTPLLIMGYPMGLPLKISDGAEIIDLQDNFFHANLDSFEGNSGSPVFNRENGSVVGILVRGNPDYVKNGVCRKINRCQDGGDSCEVKGNLVAEEVLKIDKVFSILKI